MPPSKHSGSSRSAHKDSAELGNNESYTLGEYSFRIERSSGTSPDYDKIEAICTQGGKNARKSIQIPSNTDVAGWYVEANETTADVYAVLSGNGEINAMLLSSVTEVPRYPTLPQGSKMYISGVAIDVDREGRPLTFAKMFDPGVDYFTVYNGHLYGANVSGSRDANGASLTADGWIFSVTSSSKTGANGVFADMGTTTSGVIPRSVTNPEGKSISSIDISGEYLIGRFAIDLEDAGGVGPGNDWVDPGDYDPDWEEGDPTYTLYVTVTGALSGRHNDPIEDASYSYIPADKDTVKDYGCGGDGGHGGGGGAGASTVVIHKFATNQANSKEVTAIARRHGYGSGGGKGGKGGDGCILIYY